MRASLDGFAVGAALSVVVGAGVVKAEEVKPDVPFAFQNHRSDTPGITWSITLIKDTGRICGRASDGSESCGTWQWSDSGKTWWCVRAWDNPKWQGGCFARSDRGEG